MRARARLLEYQAMFFYPGLAPTLVLINLASIQAIKSNMSDRFERHVNKSRLILFLWN